MGMRACLNTLGDENIGKIIGNPRLHEKILDALDPHAHARVPQADKPTLLQRLLGKKPAPRPDPGDFVLAPGEVTQLCIDKAWHGIHYLLTKSDWEGEAPLNFIVKGGHDIGADADERAIDSAALAVIDAALWPITPQQLAEHYDAADMERLDIYPHIWSAPDNEALDYLLAEFARLKAFIHAAVERRLGVVIGLG